jgi:hypothetical protein
MAVTVTVAVTVISVVVTVAMVVAFGDTMHMAAGSSWSTVEQPV